MVELEAGEAGIEAILPDERLVRAFLHHAAVLHDEDTVGVEEGTHRSLVEQDGVYARLARLQFESGADAFRRAAE